MKAKLLYWIPHTLLLLVMVGSAIMYFTDVAAAGKAFNDLGYPSYVLYFNGIAKLLGAAAIVLPVSYWMKEWAYAGYLFIILLALQAVWITMPANGPFMLIFVALWGVCYWQFKAQDCCCTEECCDENCCEGGCCSESGNCRACLMPFAADDGERKNPEYCSYCQKDGKFAFTGTRKEFQKMCYEQMVKHGTPKLQAKYYAFMIRFAPEWKK